MRMVPAIILSFAVVAIFIFGLSSYLGSESSKTHYQIFLDDKDQVFINGVLSTKERAREIVMDKTVTYESEVHPESTISCEVHQCII